MVSGTSIDNPDQPDPPSSALRASFVDERLDAEELDRLQALRAATSENAGLYVAILSTLSEAKSSYHLQMRTAELRQRLVRPETGSTDNSNQDPALTDQALRPALDQLKEWNCLDWVQDPSIRATSIDEYLKRHELWELTSVGEATLDAVTSLLGAAEKGGSLQRTMFRQVRSSLDGLTSAVANGDASSVYLALRDLDLALSELASNAREFYATINRIAREERLEDHVFLVYKDQLIAYLQSFHDDLVRNRSLISKQLVTLETEHRDRLLQLAQEGDDSIGLFGDEANWGSRWDGMLDWFVPGRSARSEADALGGATTVAIRELLTLLRRLTEQTMRPVNRASELRETAAWFARCETIDEAHALFDAAFGLSPLLHVGFAVPDPESDGRFPSWWEIDPVQVPVSLREHGRRPAAGGTTRRRDYSEVKKLLARQREREVEQQAEAANRLVALDLSSTPIDGTAWPVLLGWIDQALAARPAASTFTTTVQTPGAVIKLSSADHDTQLLAPGGTVLLRQCHLEIVKR